jgi:chromosome segregation ATPase
MQNDLGKERALRHQLEQELNRLLRGGEGVKKTDMESIRSDSTTDDTDSSSQPSVAELLRASQKKQARMEEFFEDARVRVLRAEQQADKLLLLEEEHSRTAQQLARLQNQLAQSNEEKARLQGQNERYHSDGVAVAKSLGAAQARLASVESSHSVYQQAAQQQLEELFSLKHASARQEREALLLREQLHDALTVRSSNASDKANTHKVQELQMHLDVLRAWQLAKEEENASLRGQLSRLGATPQATPSHAHGKEELKALWVADEGLTEQLRRSDHDGGFAADEED